MNPLPNISLRLIDETGRIDPVWYIFFQRLAYALTAQK